MPVAGWKSIVELRASVFSAGGLMEKATATELGRWTSLLVDGSYDDGDRLVFLKRAGKGFGDEVTKGQVVLFFPPL